MKKKPLKRKIRKSQDVIPKGRAPDPNKKTKQLPRVSRKAKKSKSY